MDKLDKILDRVANRRFASENPSNLVRTKRDERLWKKAVLATKKRFGINKSEFEDRHWGYTVGVFRRMKGVDENPSSDDTYKIVREEIVKKKGKTPDEWGTKTKIYSIEKLQKLSRERKLDRVLKGVEPDADGAYHLDIELDENPSCEKAGMNETERTSYNKRHGSNVRPGVRDFKTVEDIRRWGSWARRFYGKKKQKFLENGELTRHACSAPAWGRKAPTNKKEAALIARDGKEALETYQYLVGEGWEIKKKLPEKLRKVLNRRWLK